MLARRILALSAAAVMLCATPTASGAAPEQQQAARVNDGVSAYKLATHNVAVRYHKRVKMWDCWDKGSSPRFAAWNGKRWVRWSVGEVSKDVKKCGLESNKVVYGYYVALKGKRIKNRAYTLVRVKEYCRGCETSFWTLPVLPPGAAAGRY